MAGTGKTHTTAASPRAGVGRVPATATFPCTWSHCFFPCMGTRKAFTSGVGKALATAFSPCIDTGKVPAAGTGNASAAAASYASTRKVPATGLGKVPTTAAFSYAGTGKVIATRGAPIHGSHIRLAPI